MHRASCILHSCTMHTSTWTNNPPTVPLTLMYTLWYPLRSSMEFEGCGSMFCFIMQLPGGVWSLRLCLCLLCLRLRNVECGKWNAATMVFS